MYEERAKTGGSTALQIIHDGPINSLLGFNLETIGKKSRGWHD